MTDRSASRIGNDTTTWGRRAASSGAVAVVVLLMACQGVAAPAAKRPPTALPKACKHVDVGAIRWDAWHGDGDGVGKAVEDTLGVEKWKNRWPVFQTRDDRGIEFNGATPEIVESEMKLAKDAGIDYWAFVYYGTGSPMSRVLEQYLASKVVGPRFALIVETNRLIGQPGDVYVVAAAKLVRDSRYLQDRNRKPVVFILHNAPGSSNRAAVEGIAKLRRVIEQEPGPAPGFVIMTFNPDQGRAIAQDAKASAISTYAWTNRIHGGTYAQLADGTEKLWDRQASTGLPVVALIMSGWDPRPRKERPNPWKDSYDGTYYQQPASTELRDHLKKGIEWTKQHSRGACSVVIYAWNEFDEGGWIAPTTGEGSKRLEAIREAVTAVSSD